jgi:hypothetical protein
MSEAGRNMTEPRAEVNNKLHYVDSVKLSQSDGAKRSRVKRAAVGAVPVLARDSLKLAA